MPQTSGRAHDVALEEAATQLETLADRITGFAIGSYLALLVASLSDARLAIKGPQLPWFAVGTGVGTLVYYGLVTWLFGWEQRIRARLPSAPDVARQVRTLIFVARLVGITIFAAIWSWALAH